MKVNIVVSRYGEDVIGGAEKHCRDIVNILPEEWDINIHTTTARDYITWNNSFKPGTTKDGNITIHRYKVDKPRNIEEFNRTTDKLKRTYPNQSLESEWDWLREQGPFSSSFTNSICSDSFKSDINIYFSYLYYPTIYGLLNSDSPSIVVPMLHDEFPAYLKIYKKVLTNNIIYAFSSPEEIDLFYKIYSFKPNNHSLIGTYIDLPNLIPSKIISTSKKYLLTIGRMDAGKGYLELIDNFIEWKSLYDSKLELWIAGKNPDVFQKKFNHPSVRFLGYISEEEKSRFITESIAVINPSVMESFSILLLESWANSTPVIVNARSEVTKGHCIRSNGGLYYYDKYSLFYILNILMNDNHLMDRMGINGREYVRRNFTKSIVSEKWSRLIDSTRIHDDNSITTCS